MPNMDGLEAARQVLAQDSRCRVLMLTTFDLDRYVYAALALGASGFLLKDVTPEHLAASVRQGSPHACARRRSSPLTAYDAELEELFGRVGRADGSRLLRRRIYAAIARAYPMLAEECQRQLRERQPMVETTGEPVRGR
ncbi:response regulator [Nonomuraea basaltis]|uniref:response regulator n=1 Tax=Nonomuraea basaltis TaxID=2495887 RepID=UPI003B845BE6